MHIKILYILYINIQILFVNIIPNKYIIFLCKSLKNMISRFYTDVLRRFHRKFSATHLNILLPLKHQMWEIYLW